jgi:hypothetical protein
MQQLFSPHTLPAIHEPHCTYPNDHDIPMSCSISPPNPINPRPVNKLFEDPARTLVRGRFSENRDNNCCRSNGVPPDGDIVQVVQDFDTERVCEALGEEYGCVNA